MSFISRCATAETKYQIITQIGKGTYGVVYKVMEKANPYKYYAMKKINFIRSDKQMSKFERREIDCLHSARGCENIIHFYEVCRANDGKGSFYLILEYCDYNLEKLLRNIGFHLAQIKNIFKQILNGLFYLHYKKRIIHRDIKPANILITKHGVVKLADFGLARSYCSLDKGESFHVISFHNENWKDVTLQGYTNNVVTLWYRPPELLFGGTFYGNLIDAWSVGCVLGELFTRTAILPGMNTRSQVELITTLCGSSYESWPEVQNLPLFSRYKPIMGRPSKIKERLGKHVKNAEAIDLIEKLLTLNPLARMDILEALDHNFFWTDPMPCPNDAILNNLKKYTHNGITT